MTSTAGLQRQPGPYQLSLPPFESEDIERDEGAPVPTIDDRFRRFHALNPWVYRELVRLARRAMQAQRHRGITNPRVGAKALVERLRWDYEIDARGTGEWRLNNDFTSRYARLIAATEPDMAEAFEFRALREGGEE